MEKPYSGSSQEAMHFDPAFGLLWLLAATVPLQVFVSIDFLGAVTRIIGIVALAAGILVILIRGKLRGLHSTHILMIGFILWSLLSYIWSVNADATLERALLYARQFGLVWLIWELAITKDRQRTLMFAYLVGTLYPIADTFYQYLTRSATDYFLRYAAEGFDLNDWAVTLAIAIAIAWYLSLTSSSIMRWVYRLYVGLAVVTILLTASRGGALAGGVALLLIPLTFARLSHIEKVIVIALVFAAIQITLSFVLPTTFDRLSTIQDVFMGGTWNARVYIWQAAWQSFMSYPLFGTGAGTFFESSNGVAKVAHNSFLSVLSDTGLIGFALFFMTLATLVRSIIKMSPGERIAWLMILLTLVVGSMSLSWEDRKPTWFIFGMIPAVYAALAPVAKTEAAMVNPPVRVASAK